MKVTDELVYLAAYEEEQHFITDSSIDVDEKGIITSKDSIEMFDDRRRRMANIRNGRGVVAEFRMI